MSKRLLRVCGIAVLACISSACGGGASNVASDAFPTQSWLVLDSDSGEERVQVRTAPDQPPTRGNVSLQLSITDAVSEEPLSGLDLKVVPWMPAMGHGTSVTPSIQEVSPGVYELRNLILYMPGTWQIRTDLVSASTDHVTPTFEIR